MTDGADLTVRTSPAPLVLVVDDDAGIRTLITEVLFRLGVGVLAAGDGMAAIELVREHRTRLGCAILDLRMPVLDGLSAARAIRTLAPELAIIMMSSSFPQGYRQQIEPLRIVHVLNKPFHLPELRRLVGEIFALLPGKLGEAEA